jgi:phospholipid/cholesterol/gamma-HCH transport system substrate-binding protein
MAKRRSRDLAVGAMFALALIVVALTIMAVGSDSRLFANKTQFRVNFPNATGLVVGSPVKMSGVQVGAVSAVRLPRDPSRLAIEVELGIDRVYAGRVREDSRAALRVLQLLTGEKFVEILPGSPDLPALAEGSEIPPSQDIELLEQAAVAAENLNDITVSLKNILSSLERGEGLMGQMITDPDFGREGLDALRGTLENVEGLTDDLREGRGFVGRLLYDDVFAAKLDDVAFALERVAQLVAAIDVEGGALGALLEDDGVAEQALVDLRAASASLRRVAEGLESGDGLIGKLINDPEYSEALATDLQALLANLAEISGKINRGDGTLGAVVNERSLYEGMEEVVAGVNDSGFARWLLRRYQKKGIKSADQESAEQEQQNDQDPNEPSIN